MEVNLSDKLQDLKSHIIDEEFEEKIIMKWKCLSSERQFFSELSFSITLFREKISSNDGIDFR